MFTKEQFEQWRLDKSNIELNKTMIEEFPFLLPRNRWTGLVSDSYDYSYNELEAMPEGWLIAFGYEMICELRDELASTNFLSEYRITDIKEKYGTLRWYDAGNTKNGHDIVSKYCGESARVCQCCGKPATHMTNGWIGYFCKECGKQLGAEPVPEDWWEEDED